MPFIADTLFIWPLFAAAVLIDIILGEYPSKMHPVVWIGSYIRRAAVVADRSCSRGARFILGAAVVVSSIIISAALCSIPQTLYLNAEGAVAIKIAAGLLTVFFIKSTFSLSALLRAAGNVRTSLDAGNLKEARKLTSYHLVSRDTGALSSNEVSAAVIESVSENFTDSVIAPWLFLFIGGAPAAAAYRCGNTCDSLLGYRNEKYEWLGKFAARFDDILNFIPARLAGICIAFSAALLRGFSGRGSLSVMLREHRVTESPNAGWTMAAAAGALGVRLVKIGCYTINGAEHLPEPTDITRIILLIRTSMIVAAASGVFAAVLISGVLL